MVKLSAESEGVDGVDEGGEGRADGRTLGRLTQAGQLPTTAPTLFEVWYIGHEE